MPELARVAFLADKRPHLIHLGFTRSCNVPSNLVRVQCTQQSRVNRLKYLCFLLELIQQGTEPGLSSLIRRIGSNMSRQAPHSRSLSFVKPLTSAQPFEKEDLPHAPYVVNN